MTKAPSSKSEIKNDAKGAFAPSQADSENNGALAIDPNGENEKKEPEKSVSKQTPPEKARG